MPLSKARNRERMRQFRLHAKTDAVVVQPNVPLYNLYTTYQSTELVIL